MCMELLVVILVACSVLGFIWVLLCRFVVVLGFVCCENPCRFAVKFRPSFWTCCGDAHHQGAVRKTPADDAQLKLTSSRKDTAKKSAHLGLLGGASTLHAPRSRLTAYMRVLSQKSELKLADHRPALLR